MPEQWETLRSDVAFRPRVLGEYVTLDPDTIRTPLGDMPITELSGLFYSQIAPPEYFAETPNAIPDSIRVNIVGPRTVEVHGNQVYFSSGYALFAFNALLALRDPRGTSRSEGFAMGMMRFNPTSRSAGDAWHLGVGMVRERLNEAAGTEMISATHSGQAEFNRARYRVHPSLQLVEQRPTDKQSTTYLEQATNSRLLALQRDQLLHVPYDTAPGVVPHDLAITTNHQIERGDRGWVLNDRELAILNLFRLTNGRPLLTKEILASGFYTRAANDGDRIEAILAAVQGLNGSVFDGPGRDTLIVDGNEPALVRLGRSVTLQDKRRLRTPTNPAGNDFALADTLQRAMWDYHEPHRERLAAYVYPETKAARTPSEAHMQLGEYAVTAFLNDKIGLRDMYMISMRLGMAVQALRGSVLPLADGTRIAYNELEPRIRYGPAPMVALGKTFGLSPTYYKRVFAGTMRRLEKAIEDDIS